MPMLKRKKSLTDDMPLLFKAFAVFITTFLAIACIVPFWLTISISFTDDAALRLEGYGLIPAKFSTAAYDYILKNGSQILRSYGVTIFVTISGTVLGIIIMTMLAYALSRPNFPWKSQFTFIVYFTMLFSGGMVATYTVFTSIYHFRDTIWALILPGCCSPMYVLILRTYMSTSIPPAVIESARIDGAREFTCYWKIVLPMAVPSIATISLFLAVHYWNDWNRAFLYILLKTELFPIQLLLKRIENEIQFLANNTDLSVTEALTIQESIPGETVKMALVVLVVTPIIVAFPFFQKYFVKGITVGAVKG